ncbi:hypothetical protein MKW98_021688, partial [Papaver atlanticum]
MELASKTIRFNWHAYVNVIIGEAQQKILPIQVGYDSREYPSLRHGHCSMLSGDLNSHNRSSTGRAMG